MLRQCKPRLRIFNTRVFTSTKRSCLSGKFPVFFSSSHTLTYYNLSPRLAAVPRVLSQPYLQSIYCPSRSWRSLSSMATATKIHLSPATDSGIYSSNVTDEGARTASEVLQADMKDHHVFF